MTDVQAWLDQGRTLADQATEGPWEVEESSDGWTEIYGRDPIEPITPTVATTERGGENEAAFIADARTRLPQALAALQAVHDLHKPVTRIGNEDFSVPLAEFDPADHPDSEMWEFEVCGECWEVEWELVDTNCVPDVGMGLRSAWPCPPSRALQAAIGDKQ